jgi:hypothetical protein
MISSFRTGCVVALLGAAICTAQTSPSTTNAITLSGTGYRTPSPSLAVAPGQLIVLHVNGLNVSTSANVVATPDSTGWPHVLNGISVDLVQGNPAAITSLEIRALYHGLCSQPDSCAPVTGITLQIPFELNAEPTGTLPVLRISQNGKPAGGVMLRAVKDNVHVMNT